MALSSFRAALRRAVASVRAWTPPIAFVGKETARLLALTLILHAVAPGTASAHGESVRGFGGVGINTIGGDVTQSYAAGLRYDLRRYTLFSDADLLRFRQELDEDVHQHGGEDSAFLSFTAPVASRFDLTVQLQANRFTNFSDNGDAYALANDAISKTSTSAGLGDLLVLLRHQLVQRSDQHVALLGGLKLPTGNYRQLTDNGELVGTHNQPGSGSVDFQVGAAYTGHFRDVVAISADVLARVNTQGAKSFRSGNSLQVDVAFGLFPHATVVPMIEVNAISQERDLEFDEVKQNSGVTSVFLTPSARVAFGGHHAVFVSVGVPIVQMLPGIQNTEQLRFGAGYSFSFGSATDGSDDDWLRSEAVDAGRH